MPCFASSRGLLVRLALLLPLVCASLAQAHEPPAVEPRACDRLRHPGLPSGLVNIGFFEADFASGRRACPKTDLGLFIRGAAVLDTPNFYGYFGATGMLTGSYALGRRGEIFGTLEFVNFLFVQNASLKGTTLGLGQLTVGGSLVALERRTVTLAPYTRLMLPTSSQTPNVRTIGVEVGMALHYAPLYQLALHGALGGDFSAGLSAGPANVRGGLLLTGGIEYAPWSWLMLALDLNLHMGYRGALDYLAPALGLRFRLYRGLSAELDVAAPLAGADRRLFLGGLRITYRF